MVEIVFQWPFLIYEGDKETKLRGLWASRNAQESQKRAQAPSCHPALREKQWR